MDRHGRSPRPVSVTARTVLPVRIAGTGSVLPGPPVATATLVARTGSGRAVVEVEARTGIMERHFAGPDDSAAGLGVQALRLALDAARMQPEALARIVFVNSYGGDALIPATANRVAAGLGVEGTCDCFDLNNACMGFLSAFDVGTRSVAPGLGPVAVVVAEIASRFTTPTDPRPYLVLADSAAAVVLDVARGGAGVLGTWLRNDGTKAGDVSMDHPGLTRRAETVRFGSPNEHMTTLAVATAQRSVEGVHAPTGLTLEDVDWLLLHQPTGTLMQRMVDALRVDPRRVVPVAREAGSVAAASIPLSLDRLLRTRPVHPGQRILMVGVGAGIACGAILYQTGD